jgi:hypothetical protein
VIPGYRYGDTVVFATPDQLVGRPVGGKIAKAPVSVHDKRRQAIAYHTRLGVRINRSITYNARIRGNLSGTVAEDAAKIIFYEQVGQ